MTDHRAELLSALHILIRGWAVQDRPQTETRSDSFAAFAHATQGVLAVAGIPGQVMSEASNKASIGTDDLEWAALLVQLVRMFGVNRTFTAKDVSQQVVHERFMGHQQSPNNEAMFDSLPDDLARRASRGESIARSLGLWLRHREGRYAGGLAVRAAGEDRNGVKHYKVVTSGAGTAGTEQTANGRSFTVAGVGGGSASGGPPTPGPIGSSRPGMVPALPAVPATER